MNGFYKGIKMCTKSIYLFQLLSMAICGSLFEIKVFAQPCDSITPSFIVDLSNNPDSLWISADTIRDGHCCGYSNPDRCIEFLVTLDSNAEAIIFDIYSGAVPPGALFYQINCSSPTLAGEPVCLIGVGPHRITFCKPGNNTNEYSIQSIAKPSVSADIAVNQGCTGTMFAYGYDISTISWTSVNPGAIGTYNSYLSCTSACDSVVATGGIFPPPYVDYQVCGTPAGGCDSLLIICDTARVYFNTELFANIVPGIPTICFGDSSITLTANGIGGTPPYSWLWSTGDTTQSITVDSAGTFSVMVGDTSYPGCPPSYDTVVVTEFTSAIIADAGPDISVCESNPNALLSGSVFVATGGTWSGGGGVFDPSPDSLNTTYKPSGSEISNHDTVVLVLTTTGNGSCPPDADTMLYIIHAPPVAGFFASGDTFCYGDTICFIDTSFSVGGVITSWLWNFDDGTTSTQQNPCHVPSTPGDTDYDIKLTVTDSNGCSNQTTDLELVIIKPIKLTVTRNTGPKCNGGCNGHGIHIDVADGLPPYSFIVDTASSPPFGSAFWASPNEFKIHQVCAGIYTVTFYDSWGCDTTISVTVTENITLIATIIDSANVTCNGAANGQATVLASGGKSPYDYLWNTIPLQTTSTATGLGPGTWCVTVTDDDECEKTACVTITQPPPLTATITAKNDASCFGMPNGSATVAASGGTTPYSYLWNTTPVQTISTATALAAGNYIVTISDSNGCITTVNVTINEPAILTAAISSTNVSCNGGSDGTATVSTSGGTPFYTYLWSAFPAQTDAAATGLTPGNYTVTVTDANGCDTTSTITISEPGLLIATINFPENPLCNSGTDGGATATGISGTPPYTYSWNTFPPQTTAVATGLSNGIHTVTITDSKGCSASASVIIIQPSALTLSVSTVAANCGACDGSATVSASGGTPYSSGAPYIYSWFTTPVQNTPTATGLCPGSYPVTVSDSNGCAAIASADITNLDVTITLNSVINATCYGDNDGQAAVTASGSTPPYTYQWSSSAGSQTTSTATGLSAGNYNVTATDFNGCQNSLTVTVTQPLPVISSISKTNVNCNGDSTGQATVTSSGQSPPYTFLWNTIPTQTDSIATDLKAGIYSVTVTDALGCDTVTTVSITQPPLLTLSATAAGVSCYGANDGSATATAAGGVPFYTYLWSASPSQTNATATGLGPGTYLVTVTDSNGCSAVAGATVAEPAVLSVSASSVNVSCNGACNGTATVLVTGGTMAYTYAWGTAPSQSAATATGLCPGNYTVNIMDANGCDTSANFAISEPPLLTGSITSINPVSCKGGNNGSATVTPSGGMLPYTYQWIPPVAGQAESTADSLFAGNYSVTVVDSNGCTVALSFTISEPALLTVSVDSFENVGCFGNDDGSVTAVVGGGVSGYSYLWNSTPTQSTATADDLFAGTYTVVVTDVNGCNTAATVTITQPAVLVAAITAGSNVSCNGADDGTITAAASGGTTPYSYLWSDFLAQSTATADSLAPGTYTVTVTDANGCDTIASASITEPPLLIANITDSAKTTCNGICDGTATVTAGGGTAPYTYVWCTTPFQSNNIATGLCPGNYCITVADTNGCTASDTVLIIQPPILTVSIAPPLVHVSCKGGNDGQATVIASGGTPPYNYVWNDSAAQTTASATGLYAGTYTVTVTDSNNCNSSGNITLTINEPAQNISVSIIDSADVSCNGGKDGAATAAATGGVFFYSYVWSIVPPQFTASATGLSSGVYTVTASDGNGCAASATVNIGQPPALISTITGSINVSCKNGNDGSATVAASGGTSPYTYSWNTIPVQTGTIATGLDSGTYTVTVSDSNNCDTSSTVTITQPDSLLLTIAKTDANCGNPDGAASVAVTGGTPPYSYLWTPGGVANDSITGVFSGIYTVNVTDSNGCIDSAKALVNDIVVFIIQDSTDNLTCYGGTDGTIQITITSGTPPFTYAWSHDPLLNSPLATGLSAGVYYLTVTDSNACNSTKQLNISGPVALLDSIYFQNITCFGDSNGQASVFPVGGTPPYTFLWNTVPAQTDSIATGLKAGIYSVTITDTLGCDTIVTIAIAEPDTMVATITNVVNAGCNGSCNGSATVVGSGGTYPYGYSWNSSPVKKDSTATGLCPDSYIVTLMDMNGCLAYADTVITDPDTLFASITSAVNVSCNGYNDGQATVTATGGTPGYSYFWTSTTPQQTNSTATGLEPISHTVTVIDTNGCSDTAGVTITEPSVFAANSGGVTHVSCNGGNDGSALVSAFGGTIPYSYFWSTVPVQTDSVATGLSAGTDTVIVSDFNGCADTVTVVINEPLLLTAVITDSVNISCFGGNDGEATVTASGGTGLYAYLWSDTDTQITQTATGLPAGSYIVTVTDNNGCDTTANVTITEPPVLTVSVTGSINVSCSGGNDGFIFVSVSGGTSPYTYLWDDDSIQTADSAFALTVGIYTLTVTDTMGCDTTASDTISEPDLLAAVISSITNVNCNGDSTGSATVNVSGGTPPYTYLWDDTNAQTDTLALNLPADTFNVIVIDFMGCDTTINAIVTEPDSLINTFTNITHINCYGDSTGEITANSSGGLAPYAFLWSISDTSQLTNSTISGLTAGSYTLTITDSLNCTYMDSLTLTEQPEIVITAPSDTFICVGMSVVISASAVGGTGNLSFIWSGGFDTTGQGPFTVQPVDTTSYILTITDSLGCQVIDSITVNVAPFLIIFVVPDSICVGDSTTIGAIVAGGDGNYNFYWNTTGDTTSSITVQPQVTTYYTLTITDGCGTPQVSDSVLVEVNPYPVVGLFPSDASGCESVTIGFIDLIADIPGSIYTWFFGDGNTDTTTNPFVIYTYNNTGIFNVSVWAMSPQGCQTDSINVSTIIISPTPTANFTGVPIDTAIAQPTVAFTDLSYGDPTIGDTISSWYWDFGDGVTSILQDPTHDYADTGIYTVMLAIINQYGCVDTIIKTIISCSNQLPGNNIIVLSPIPAVTCIADPAVTTAKSPTINFSSSVSAIYHWDFGDGDTSNVKDPVHTYKDTGTYNVILNITNIYRCVNECILDVIINPYFEIKVPNAFTPNPDGPNGGVYDHNTFDNNVFFPVTDYIDEFHMMIFNRWGELVFESFDLKIGWDGYYRGKLSQQDAYAWKIEARFINGQKVNLVGDVTLIR